MRILAFDTSTASCSVALWDHGDIVAKGFEPMPRGQSEALVPMIGAVLAQAGIKPPQVDLLAVTTGPGAFTGVRIGLATARGFALAIERPLIGISTFDVLVHGVGVDTRGVRPVLCVIDTKRGDLFFQEFDSGLNPVGAARVATCGEVLERMKSQDDSAPFMLVGDGAALVLASCDDLEVDTYDAQPEATVVAEIAAGRKPPEVGAPPPGPVYLRPPEVKINPGGGRLR